MRRAVVAGDDKMGGRLVLALLGRDAPSVEARAGARVVALALRALILSRFRFDAPPGEGTG